jgi:transcriptional regulator NrdR
MRCPVCGYNESKVIDSRPIEDNVSIRRRRECLSCQKRFTTYEIIDTIKPTIVKKDGRREHFDKNKLLVGLLKACERRPVDAYSIAAEIEAELLNTLKGEVSSAELGVMAMEKLRERDAVAYVRFASVHREFKDVETFLKELEGLKTANSDE